jgi:antirestriction protein ArdC
LKGRSKLKNKIKTEDTMKRQKSQKDWYKEITNLLLTLIEHGKAPWQCPYLSGMMSMQSQKPYQGVNALVLSATAAIEGYQSRWWITFKRAKELGGYVKKGEKGTAVFKWVWRTIENEKETKTGEIEIEAKIFGMLLYAGTVFNLDQCQNIDPPEETIRQNDPLKQCEEIYQNMSNKPSLRHAPEVPCYLPSKDMISIAPLQNFQSSETYYSTFFHELTHSTGHISRLARKETILFNRFGSHDYSVEELVAEFGSAFLCTHCGIEKPVIENSAAYLRGWAKRLQKDKKFVVMVAQRAQRAVEFILRGASLS